MASVEKIFGKMSDKPYRSDIMMSELHKVLLHYGFELSRNGSSHRHYKHKSLSQLITIPAHRDSDKVLPVYVKMVFNIIVENNL